MLFEIICSVFVPILLYVVISYIEHLLECRKLPRGPFPLPIVGNLHLFGTRPYQTFANYSKLYGNVFSISFGMKRVVIISDITATREALIEKAIIFAGRPKSYNTEMFSRGYKDIAFKDYGPLWKLLRKIGHSSLKIYGEGAGRFETLMIKESDALHERLKKKSKNPMELQTEFGVAILNVICVVVFGKRYDYSDSEFTEILMAMNKIIAGISNTTAFGFIPLLQFLPLNGITEFQNALSKFFLILKQQLIKHRETYDENNIRDFTDSVLKLSKDKNMSGNIIEELTDDHLEHILGDIFLAGTETTMNTLLWSIVYMINYPKFQDELFNEIITVVGEHRYPCLSDRDSLHLVKASLKETLRASSLSPLGLPHKTTSETTLANLFIPKGTTIMINLWQLHHDSKYWHDPEEFNPYRWLNEDKKIDLNKATSYLPFSAGTRVCLGKVVAEAELFVFFTRLIRDFKFEVSHGCPPPKLDGKYTATINPEPFDVLLTPRANNLMLSEKMVP